MITSQAQPNSTQTVDPKRINVELRQPDGSISVLTLEYSDLVEFHVEEDEGMPWTSLRRDYRLMHEGKTITAWWEESAGYYGGGYTGWWVEELDSSGPPEGLKEFLASLNIEWPETLVPRPPSLDDEHGGE